MAQRVAEVGEAWATMLLQKQSLRQAAEQLKGQ
jgi:hypothetical protein